MNEVKEVSAYFEKIIDAREQMNENDILDAKPYYIIFSMTSDVAGEYDDGLITAVLPAHKAPISGSILSMKG